MPNKTKLPETFGHKYSQIVISSIAGLTICEDGIIKINLKSGEVVELEFHVDYLAEKAYAALRERFNATDLENNPCKICAKEDKNYACKFCKSYDRFEAPKE